jgi:hypothetical protein
MSRPYNITVQYYPKESLTGNLVPGTLRYLSGASWARQHEDAILSYPAACGIHPGDPGVSDMVVSTAIPVVRLSANCVVSPEPLACMPSLSVSKISAEPSRTPSTLFCPA